jgi:hypothetical protein
MVGPSPTQTRRECPLPGCDEVVLFGKDEYRRHMKNHNTQPPAGQYKCQTCNWPFDDSLALEEHQRNSGHVPHECNRCQQVFGTASLLGKHKQFPSKCSDALGGKRSPTHHCSVCRKSFASTASFNNHFLMCTPAIPLRENASPRPQSLAQAPGLIGPAHPADHLSKPKIVAAQEVPALGTLVKQLSPSIAIVAPTQSIEAATATRICEIEGCKMFFNTEAGLMVHKQDKHGVGGKALDITGKDSWMLSQYSRNMLRDAGILRSAGDPPMPSRSAAPKFAPRVPAAPLHRMIPPSSLAPTARASRSPSRMTQKAVVSPQTAPGATVTGLDEMNQARHICDKIMRLVLQSDVFIYHTGKITCSGIDWTRIPCAKQVEVVEMFSGLCHLPPKFKTEFVPAPTTYKDEYVLTYPAAELKLSPELSGSICALPVVAISCSKVILSNGLQEAVKLAAVDVISCRILMNHLVCTDPKDPVMRWNSKITGLNGYLDIEAARGDGYKVLKGWTAARAALWKFINRDTILVGWNIRADLDSLRMIHGRAVDVAKTFEKAAGGPLSKPQVSLESLCRDLPALKLTNHAIHGRDALQNAFAVREVGLWMLKNKDKLTKIAKQKALDYSRLA